MADRAVGGASSRPRCRLARRGATLVVLMTALGTGDALAADDVAGHLVLLNDNGAWSWFEDERAIVDPDTGNVLVGSIANASGAGGASRDGSVEIAGFNLATRRVRVAPLARIRPDDHNTPALLVRPDGKYLAAYANHGSDRFTRTSVSTHPGDPTSWRALPDFTNPAGATYNNVFRLAGEGKTYNFTRTTGYDPNYLTSDDDGLTWTHGGKLLQDPANNNGTRPYVKYASNHVDRVHFITTEGHPRDYNNGVYHGYLRGGKLYRSDGTAVGTLGSAPAADAFTPLLLPNEAVNGTTRNHAWTTDLALDASGNPVAVFTSRVNSSTADHRFYYARFAGGAWRVNEMARAGGFLYAAEADYTGLAAIDPRKPDTVYLSSKISPQDNGTLAHYEIFKGVTPDGGATWNWTPVTQDSTVDNIRPIVPAWAGGTALMWLRGTYTTYVDYDLSVVGLVDRDGETTGTLRYTDATPANTTLATGAPLDATGPTANGGPTDGRWHRRDGFGNGDQVFTAGEGGDEDAPALRTTVPNLAPGDYDVFGFFWANPAEDWQVAFGLAADDLRTFRQDFAEQATAGEFDGTVVLTGSTVNLYKAYLGRVKLEAGGPLPVFVDDSPRGSGAFSRTWFDGVGVAAVAPEPGFAPVPVALIAARRRRRRQLCA